jgi:Tfp pilus assembly protein PilO
MLNNNFSKINLKNFDSLTNEDKDQLFNEGYDYLSEVIQDWKVKGNSRFMVALAKFAFKWNEADGGPQAKIKALEIEEREMTKLIAKRTKANKPVETYQQDLIELKEQLTKLREMYPSKAKAA